MFIQVKLLTGFPKPLWYAVPAALQKNILAGTLVHVPLRNHFVSAVVVRTSHSAPSGFTIKEIESIDAVPHDQNFKTFLKKIAMYNQIDELHFYKRIRQFLAQKEIKHEATHNPDHAPISHVTLTDEQQKICNFLTPKIVSPTFCPTLLHGLTGSGKTEVYKKLIKTAFDQKKATVLLLPEVTLAIAFEHRLRHELADSIPIYSFHSGTSAKQKKLLWQLLLEQEPCLILGVHLPILMPIANLGLIIVDEEHESGYQEKKHPKINSKEASLLRAQTYNIPILLGSATPSLSSLHSVKTKGWHFFELKKRFSGTLPTVKTVLLTDKKKRKNFWISQQLFNAIKDRLAKEEQTIIFLNRRGYSFFVQCSGCSYTFSCSSCSVSLTLHQNNTMTCHYCGYAQQLPPQCPECKVDEKDFLKKGIGTQQVVTILQKLFPQARIARADLDTTVKKKAWQQTMKDFAERKIDIMVGTQTITKGYDFPGVTLVGVLWADLNLNFPIYNAAETTLQQLIQVAGRAGRHSSDSLVIVQAMMDHDIFSFLNETDYLTFYKKELAARAEIGYPPCKRLAEIELKNMNEVQLEYDADELIMALFAAKQKKQFEVSILGPAKPPISKIKNTHVRKIYLKSTSMATLLELCKVAHAGNYKSSVFFTPNPTT